MKKYSELGSVYRNEPCVEYPGTWLVYENGGNEKGFATFSEAWDCAKDLLDKTELPVSICWACSDNDPRVGEVWFTGFYEHGYFNTFGKYEG